MAWRGRGTIWTTFKFLELVITRTDSNRYRHIKPFHLRRCSGIEALAERIAADAICSLHALIPNQIPDHAVNRHTMWNRYLTPSPRFLRKPAAAFLEYAISTVVNDHDWRRISSKRLRGWPGMSNDTVTDVVESEI